MRESERDKMEVALGRLNFIDEVIRKIEYEFNTSVHRINYDSFAKSVSEKEALLHNYLKQAANLPPQLNHDNVRILKSIFLTSSSFYLH